MTATAIWESLPPNYAWAQQVPKDDKRLKTEYATVPSPEGNGSIRGYFVRPANATGKLPGVIVVHENRGLNPYIEDVARRLGTENFMAFAPDGHLLASASGDIHLWETDPHRAIDRICQNAGDLIDETEWAKNVPDAPFQRLCS